MAEHERKSAGGKQVKERLLRLSQVLNLIPVSKSTWWDGVKKGRFPKSIKLGIRTTCWRESEILALMQREK